MQSEGLGQLLSWGDASRAQPNHNFSAASHRGAEGRPWTAFGGGEEPSYPQTQRAPGGTPGPSRPQKYPQKIRPTQKAPSYPQHDGDAGQDDDGDIDWLTLAPKGAKKNPNAGGGGIAFPSRQNQGKGAWMGGKRDSDSGSTMANPGLAAKKHGQKQLAGEGVSQATKGDEVTSTRDTQLQNVEKNLLALNLERDKFKAELDKIPESAKTMVQIRRRQHLETELKMVNKNISNLKSKLRQMGELQTNYS